MQLHANIKITSKGEQCSRINNGQNIWSQGQRENKEEKGREIRKEGRMEETIPKSVEDKMFL